MTRLRIIGFVIAFVLLGGFPQVASAQDGAVPQAKVQGEQFVIKRKALMMSALLGLPGVWPGSIRSAWHHHAPHDNGGHGDRHRSDGFARRTRAGASPKNLGSLSDEIT
ncbi:MAG: hypothetical protein V7704_11520 [Aurantimonas endophytica]|uniref:hypothetical protein n=1 Tax=Aurantimonas endophytica TaxID=1522175 RepID=UPI003001A3F9